MRDDVLQQAAERFTHAEVSRRLLEVQVHLEMLKARLIRGENELSKSLSLSASASPSKNSKYSSSPSSVLTETSIELAEIRQHILVDCANHAIVLRRCAPTPGRYSNKRAVRKFARWDRKVEVFVQELRMKHKYLVKLSKRRKEKKKEKIKRRQDGVQREIWPASKNRESPRCIRSLQSGMNSSAILPFHNGFLRVHINSFMKRSEQYEATLQRMSVPI